MKPSHLKEVSFISSSVILAISLIGLSPKSVYSFPPNLSTEVAQQTPSIGREARSFFETGRLTSEDRLLFQSPPNGIIPVRQTSNSWQFILFKEGGVSFWIPPGILTEEAITLATPLGDLNFRTLTSNLDDKTYVAAYARGLSEQQRQNPDSLLQAIRDKVTPKNEFKLIRRRSVTLDSYPGEELSFQNDQEIITFRAYLVNDRLYVLGVRSPQSINDLRSTRAFLNALELLN